METSWPILLKWVPVFFSWLFGRRSNPPGSHINVTQTGTRNSIAAGHMGNVHVGAGGSKYTRETIPRNRG
jgi:hypothetical protein